MKHEDIAAQAAAGLAGLAPVARARVEATVREAVLGATAMDVLGFRTGDGSVLKPAASADYAQALWCFIRNKPFHGAELESLVNAPIMAAVERSLSEVLMSETTLAHLIASPDLGTISGEIGDAARGLSQEELQWLRREVSAVAGLPVTQTLETKIGSLAIEQAGLFFKSAAGATLLNLIAKMTATTAGKVIVMKLLKAAAAKAVVSTAFKAVILSFVKKAGVVMLVKAALAAAVSAGLPMYRLNRLPPLVLPVVLIGLVGAFLVHEIWEMPKKLAATLPGQIGEKIQSQWDDITTSYVAALGDAALSELADSGQVLTPPDAAL